MSAMQAIHLKNVVEQHPECLVAAYADLRTHVALVIAEGPVSVPMDAMEELCYEAAHTLGPIEMPNLGGSPTTLAMKWVESAFFLYLRAPDEPTEAYVFMCRPSVDVEAFATGVQRLIGGPE